MGPGAVQEAGWTRRRMLAATVVGGAGAVLSACTGDETGAPPGTTGPGGTAAGAAPPGTGPVMVGSVDPVPTLFEQDDLNYETLNALGGAAHGLSDVGELLATVAAIQSAGPSYDTYVDGFLDRGERQQALGDAARDAGDDASARSAYLRASDSAAMALFFVLGTTRPDREASIYELVRDRFERSIELMEPAGTAMPIAYEGRELNGYFFPSSGAPDPAPTIVFNNGSDGQTSEIFHYVAGALDRGFHAVLFDGPGQGSSLFLDEVPFRSDWEQVIGPVLDAVEAQPSVDRERIGLVGWSMGGELVARAAAFEPRLAAVCMDPGCVSAWEAFPEELREISEAGDEATVNGIWQSDVIPGSDPEQAFTLKKRLEIFSAEALRQARAGEVPQDWYGLSRTIQQFQVRDVASRIRIPTLVAQYQDDFAYPGQGTEMMGLLDTDATLHEFDSSDGTELHCAPLGPQRRNEVVLDWFRSAMGS